VISSFYICHVQINSVDDVISFRLKKKTNVKLKSLTEMHVMYVYNINTISARAITIILLELL